MNNENLDYHQHGIKRCEKNLVLVLFYLDGNDKLIVIFTFLNTNSLNFEKEVCITLRFLTGAH